jgi:hypothetical protein
MLVSPPKTETNKINSTMTDKINNIVIDNNQQYDNTQQWSAQGQFNSQPQYYDDGQYYNQGYSQYNQGYGQKHRGHRINSARDLDSNNDGYYTAGEVDPNCEYPSGPCVCYCPYTKFEPCYYTVKRCVEEPYTEYKRCCRYVPKYYDKQCCRYVPQYYTQTCCKYEPEYYCVPVQKCRTREICERKCRYVPCTYTKKSCVECPPADNACPGGSCPGGVCPAR